MTRKRGGSVAGRMTTRRAQVLEELVKARQRGVPITLSRIARRCGLYDYRDARRIVRDLERYGMI